MPIGARHRAINAVMLKHGVSLPEACCIIDSMDLDDRGELYEGLIEKGEVEYVLLA